VVLSLILFKMKLVFPLSQL